MRGSTREEKTQSLKRNKKQTHRNQSPVYPLFNKYFLSKDKYLNNYKVALAVNVLMQNEGKSQAWWHMPITI